jgi:hypothetical protein
MVRYLLLLAVILYASSNLVAGVPTNSHRHHDRSPRRRYSQYKYFHIDVKTNESTVAIVPVSDKIDYAERSDGFEIRYRKGNTEETKEPEEHEEQETAQETFAEDISKGRGDKRASSWISYLIASVALGLLIGAEEAG